MLKLCHVCLWNLLFLCCFTFGLFDIRITFVILFYIITIWYLILICICHSCFKIVYFYGSLHNLALKVLTCTVLACKITITPVSAKSPGPSLLSLVSSSPLVIKMANCIVSLLIHFLLSWIIPQILVTFPVSLF